MRIGLFRLSSAIALLSIVAGCGGGGGGGSGNDVFGVPFTSFLAIQPGQTVDMSGVSQVATGTQTGPLGSETITSANLNAADTSSSTLTLGFDHALNLTQISVRTPQSSLSFTNGVSCASGLCTASNSTSEIIGIDPRFQGWNYQTFGIWDKSVGVSNFEAGAISAGSATPGSAVPMTGIGNFTGLASGFYVDGTGTVFGTAANMTATADFGARSISFSTSGTQVSSGGSAALNTDLNLSGTLTYGSGTNQFSGTVNAAGLPLTGSATGRFFGPNAEEIGGVYGLSGSGTERMMGGFGGRQ